MDILGITPKDLLSGFVGVLLGAVLTAAVAAWAIWRQVREMRQGMQAQTYLSILKRAEDIGLSETMDFIRLSVDIDKPGSDGHAGAEASHRAQDKYRWFSHEVSPAQRLAVRKAIDFFNDLAHLMRNGYIDDHYVARLYYPSVHACALKLAPWWVKCIRTEHREENLYRNFENLCDYILDLHGDEDKWPGFGEWVNKAGLAT